MLKSLPEVLFITSLFTTLSSNAVTFADIFCCCCGNSAEVPEVYKIPRGSGQLEGTDHPVIVIDSSNTAPNINATGTQQLFNQWNQMADQIQGSNLPLTPVTRQNAIIPTPQERDAFLAATVNLLVPLGGDDIPAMIQENENTNDEPETQNQNDNA